MKVRRFARQFACPTIALALLGAGPLSARAQDSHSSMLASQNNELTAEQKSKSSLLLKKVRDATQRFQNVEVAEGAGYELLFGCVSGDTEGAMGLHYVNMTLLQNVNTSGVFYVNQPQIVIYEPTTGGHLRLTGADYLVYADAWDKLHPGDPPKLMGQLFHLFETPNRFGLPAFYSLHAWAWKDNPNGAFVNWHPNVSCEQFTGKDD